VVCQERIRKDRRMKKGDLVRFKSIIDHQGEVLSDWKHGVIVKYYEPSMKIVTILYEGELLDIRARHVQIHQRCHYD
jgi:hypothetical protein